VTSQQGFLSEGLCRFELMHVRFNHPFGFGRFQLDDSHLVEEEVPAEHLLLDRNN